MEKFEIPKPENYRNKLADDLKKLRGKEEGSIVGPVKKILGISGKQKAEKLLKKEKRTYEYKKAKKEKAGELPKEERKERWIKLGNEALQRELIQGFNESDFNTALKFYEAAGNKEKLTKLGDLQLEIKPYMSESEIEDSIYYRSYKDDMIRNEILEAFKSCIKAYESAENTERLFEFLREHMRYYSSREGRFNNYDLSSANLAYRAIENIYKKYEESGKMTSEEFLRSMKNLEMTKNELNLQYEKDKLEKKEDIKYDYTGRSPWVYDGKHGFEKPQSIIDLKRKYRKLG